MYTLIGSPKTRAFRVLWALEELGLPYEIEHAFPHSEQARAANPSGKVPALSVDGEVIIDSVAIVQYLADKHGGLGHPAGSLERARQDSFTQFVCDEIDGTCWVAAKHSFVMPEELRQKEAVRPALAWDIARAMAALEARVGDSEWLGGDRFSVPDLLLGHCAGWMRVCGFDAPTGKTAALLERIAARPALQRAMAIREAS